MKRKAAALLLLAFGVSAVGWSLSSPNAFAALDDLQAEGASACPNGTPITAISSPPTAGISVAANVGHSWSRSTNASAGAGAWCQSNTTGDSLTFTFTNTSSTFMGGFSIYVDTCPTCGIADFYEDGALSITASVDTYAATNAWQVVAFNASAGNYQGTHTLKVVVSGRREASSTGNNLRIDFAEATANTIATTTTTTVATTTTTAPTTTTTVAPTTTTVCSFCGTYKDASYHKQHDLENVRADVLFAGALGIAIAAATFVTSLFGVSK